MAKITYCKARMDYQLQLRFDDGLSGKVDLGPLLSIGAFQLLREVRIFNTVHVDPETETVRWSAAGVRLDPEIFYQVLETRGGKRQPPRQSADAFQRFMIRVLGETHS